jgi:hypothetical protein
LLLSQTVRTFARWKSAIDWFDSTKRMMIYYYDDER